MIFICVKLLLKSFNFFLVPLYTAYLSTFEYGMTNIASSFLNTIVILVSFDLSFAVSRYYAKYAKEIDTIKRLFGTILSFSFISSVIFSLCAIIFRSFFLNTFFSGFNYNPQYLSIIFTVPVHCIYTLYLDILSGMQDAKRSAAVSLSFFLIQFLLIIYFIIRLRLGVNGIFYASLISYSLGTLWVIIDLKKRDLLKICIDFKLLIEVLKYSVPIIPHSFSSSITQLLSKLFIGNIRTLSMVGLFGLAGQFGYMADVIQGGVSSAFQPWLYKQLTEKESDWKEEISFIIEPLLWLLGLLFILLSLFSQEAILIMASEKYSAAWMIVPLMVTVYSIKTPYYFYVAVLFYNKYASRYVFVLTIISNIVNIILSYVMIKCWGMYGSSYADAIAVFVLVYFVYKLSIKYEDIGISLKRFQYHTLINILFIFGGMLPSYVLYENRIILLNIMYKCFIVFVYLIVCICIQKKMFFSILKFRKK